MKFVQSRTHEQDVTGHLLDGDWEMLVLPMQREPVKPKWWNFVLKRDFLLLMTPWALFIWSDYGKDFLSCGYWRGFEVSWAPNRDVQEGDCYFNKSFRLVTDYVPYVDQFMSVANL